MSSQQRKIRNRWTRRLISLFVLIGILGSFVPLPAALSVCKDLSKPFPCQQRACGCRSAYQCWKRCCCFTNSQKVAWAKLEQVALPDFVIVTARIEEQTAAHQAKECCQARIACHKKSSVPATHSAAPATGMPPALLAVNASSAAHCDSSLKHVELDQAQSALPTPASCESAIQVSETGHPAAEQIHDLIRTKTHRVQRDGKTKYVLRVLVLQCEGQGWFWNSLPWSIMPEAPEFSLALFCITETPVVHSDRDDSLALRPPVPPPRCESALVAV
jgi:hypothetical protein